MKKFLLLFFVLFLFTHNACAILSPVHTPVPQTVEVDEKQTCEIGPFAFLIPANWSVTDITKDKYETILYSDTSLADDNGLMVIVRDLGQSFNVGDNYERMCYVLVTHMSVFNPVGNMINHNGENIYLWNGEYPLPNKKMEPAAGLLYIHDNAFLFMAYVNNGINDNDLSPIVEKIASTIVIGAVSDSSHSQDIGNLESMPYDELIELRRQIDVALLSSDGWREAIIPQGDYIVGKDIPAGEWSISLGSDDTSAFGEIKLYPDEQSYLDQPILNLIKDEILQPGNTLTVRLKEGNYIVFQMCPMRIMPYTGAASLFN